jgi:hypothetical protein
MKIPRNTVAKRVSLGPSPINRLNGRILKRITASTAINTSQMTVREARRGVVMDAKGISPGRKDWFLFRFCERFQGNQTILLYFSIMTGDFRKSYLVLGNNSHVGARHPDPESSLRRENCLKTHTPSLRAAVPPASPWRRGDIGCTSKIPRGGAVLGTLD